MSNTNHTAAAKKIILSLGFKASDFSVRRITALCCNAEVSITARREMTSAEMAKVQNAFAWGKIDLSDMNGTGMIWE